MKFQDFDYKVQKVREGIMTSKEMDDVEKYLFSLKTDDQKVIRKSLKDKFKKLSDKDIDLLLDLL